MLDIVSSAWLLSLVTLILQSSWAESMYYAPFILNYACYMTESTLHRSFLKLIDQLLQNKLI